jgi:hypothetical protein
MMTAQRRKGCAGYSEQSESLHRSLSTPVT